MHVLPAERWEQWKPFRPSTMRGEAAALSRRIGTGCSIRCKGSENVAIRLQRAERFPDDIAALMELHAPQGTIECTDGARLVRALTGIDIGAADEAGMAWSCLEAAVLGRLKGTPFAATTGMRRVGSVSREPDLVALRLMIESPSYRIALWARADAATWLAFLDGARWVCDARDAEDFTAFDCAFPVNLARHALPRSGLRGVAVGDIFLPSAANFTCEGRGRVAFGGLVADVAFLPPGELQIDNIEPGHIAQDVDIYRTEEDGNMSTQANTLQDGEADGLDDYSVTLDFDLGKLHLSFGELRTLCAGAVLSVAGGSPSYVAIRTGGRLLGRGEIVDVEGQLGIRVTHWLEQRNGTA